MNIMANYASALYHPGIELLTSIGTVIVVGVGGLMGMRGEMPVSDIVGFVMYLSLFYAPLTVLMRLVEDVQVTYAGASRIFEIYDEVPDIEDAPGAEELTNCSGEIAFEDVSFRYNGGEPVLKKLNFTARPGEMVSFVGPTGSGKTTVTMLLERFYDPGSGRIMIDGRNAKDFKLNSLRNNISIVFQDTFLFNGTVAENIAFGRPARRSKKSARPRARRRRTASSPRCPTATIRRWANAARGCPAGRSSASRSRERSYATRRYSSSTRRRRRSTPTPRRRSNPRSINLPAAGRSSSSRTAFRP